MPVYNTSKYLRECLDSILSQSESNWELLAVNDLSTDDSLSILEEYQSKDPRIKVFTNDNKGIIGALRLAYNNSKGKYISRMDSDDIMFPNKLEIMKSQLIEKGTGHIAVGLVKYFSDNGLGEGYQNYETWLNGLNKEGTGFSEIYKECIVPSPCWMVDRYDFEKCEALVPNNYPEDYDLTFRFYKYGLKLIPSNHVLHKWRDYDTRTSRVDDHYADNSFIALKMKYFIELELNKEKQLLLWGAGKKGKKIAQTLNEHKIDFTWICDNPKKVGREIYGKYLEDFQSFKDYENYQSIISVANPKAQELIKQLFKKKGLINKEDYFFFC